MYKNVKFNIMVAFPLLRAISVCFCFCCLNEVVRKIQTQVLLHGRTEQCYKAPDYMELGNNVKRCIHY